MELNLSQFKLSKKDLTKGLELPSKITSDLAYIIGVLAGDGNIFVRKDKHDYRVKCVGNPLDEMQFYKDILVPLFKKVFNIQLDIKYQDSNSTYGFYIYSKSLVEFLNDVFELPIGKKYGKLKIPTLIKENNLTTDFIRGLADTDFCVTFRGNRKFPSIVGSSKSKSFFLEVSQELKKMGFTFYEVYGYKLIDSRFKIGYSLINKIEINGEKNFHLWMRKIGFFSPKHLRKIARGRFELPTSSVVS
tara:strand:+ start:10888 stop:11625 length:738 start_codon:yes stop_codon:yes gene_type:complete